MLDAKRLRTLWELHARGTVAAVAEALSYTPSAVSQQLAALEREAGTRLLRRTGRRLELTAAGEALVAETETLLAGLERAEAALHRLRPEVSGTFRLALFQTAMLTLLPDAMRRLRTGFPALRVEAVQYEPEAALRETRARSFDLVVAEQYPDHSTAHFPGLDREFLLDDPMELAVPPAGAASDFDRVRTLTDAARLPWVMEPRGAASRHFAETTCRSAGFEPDVRFETADLQAHVRLIESGNAVAILPALVHGGGARRVRSVPLAGAPHRTIFTAARVSSGAHPALAAVRAALADAASTAGAPIGSPAEPL